MANSSDENLDELAIAAGADPSRISSKDARASIPMFARIKGGKPYRDRLRDAARELYDDLRQSQAVQAAQGKTLIHEGRSIGSLGPFPSQSHRPRIDALVHLLHSLAYIGAWPMKNGIRLDYVAVPMATDAFSTDAEYGHLQRDAFRQNVLALVVSGKLGYRPAFYNAKTGLGKRTRVAASRPLLDWMMQRQLVFPYHPHGPRTRSKDTTILRVKQGDSPAVPLDRPLDPNEMILLALNMRLARQSLSWSLPDYATYERHYDFKKGRPPVLGGRKRLYRQFSSRDGRGGRLSGHWVQRMPSALRRLLQIDGKPVAELDYGSMQLRLLYAIQGVPLDDDGDLYDLPSHAEHRDTFKVVLTRTIGCSDRQEALETIREYLHATNQTGTGKAEALFDAFWSHHAAVDPFPDGQAAWPLVQYLESRIALHVLRILLRQGITAIPIHDSFVVQAQHKDALRDAMAVAFKNACPDVAIRID